MHISVKSRITNIIIMEIIFKNKTKAGTGHDSLELKLAITRLGSKLNKHRDWRP